MGYNGYTEKKKETNKRYLENNNIVRMSLVLPEEEKIKITEAAKRSGQSINRFILDAVKEKIEKSWKVY